MIQDLERVVGVVLLLTSNTLVVTAKCQLGTAWSPLAKASYLVTDGLYTKIRNPIYVFHVFTTVGIVMILQWNWLWWLIIVEIIVQTIRAHREATTLRAAFGNDYENYCKQTWF